MINLTKKAAHNRGSLLETFRGREAGTQKPQQDAHCNKGDHTGNAMENGRYRRDGEPDGL